MNRNSIITLPHKSLRNKSTKVTVVTDKEREIVDDMIKASLDWEDHREHELCVGLAGVQVDIMKRIVIVRADQEDRTKREFITLINPKIIKTIGKPEEDFEGCLSVSDVYCLVPRYPKVKVQALDKNGKEFRLTADGFLARLLQHEVDHTNGITIVDRVEDEKGFYKMNSEGKLKLMDYEKEVKDSKVLWG